MKAKIIISVFLVVVIGLVIYLTYNKPHRNPEDEEGILVSSTELLKKFEQNEDSANVLYLDKTVVVSGKIIDISFNQENIPVVMLEAEGNSFGIQCTMHDAQINLMKNEFVTLKGICKGFLSDVIITNASVVQIKK